MLRVPSIQMVAATRIMAVASSDCQGSNLPAQTGKATRDTTSRPREMDWVRYLKLSIALALLTSSILYSTMGLTLYMVPRAKISYLPY